MERNKFIQEWLLCGVLAIFFGYTPIQFYLPNIINQDLLKILEISPGQLGLVASAMLWGMVLFLIPVGVLFDCVSPKNMFVLAGVVCLASVCLLVVDINMTTVVANRFGCAFANVCAFVGGLKMIRSFPSKRVAIATGVFFAISHLSGIVVNMPYLSIKLAAGLHNMLMVNVLVGSFVLLLVTVVIAKYDSAEGVFIEKYKESWGNLGVVFKDANVWYCGLFIGICSFPLNVFQGIFGYEYFIGKYGFTYNNASFLAGLFFVGVVIGKLLFGCIARFRTRNREMLVLGSAACLLLMLMLRVGDLFLNFNYISIIYCVLGIMTSVSLLGFISIKMTISKKHVVLQ